MTASQGSAGSVPAQPAWVRRPASLARAVTAELVERGLSPKFAGYMSKWKGFVVD